MKIQKSNPKAVHQKGSAGVSGLESWSQAQASFPGRGTHLESDKKPELSAGPQGWGQGHFLLPAKDKNEVVHFQGSCS